jgi:ankyrin repeat protein
VTGTVSSLVHLAQFGSTEEFLAIYDPAVDPFTTTTGGSTLLLRALVNKEPQARVELASRLLDDGADATVVTTDANDRVNVFHVLWGSRKDRDVDGEAALVARMLDAGADINLRSSRFGLPLMLMVMGIRDTDGLARTWDTVVAHSRPDLSPSVNKKGTTLGRNLAAVPAIADRVREYAAASGQAPALEEDA